MPAVKDTTDLIRMLGEYRRRAEWLNFHCPFHHGSKLNFGVNLSTGIYSCFACGEKGTVRQLLRKLQEEHYREGEGLLARLAGPPASGGTSSAVTDTPEYPRGQDERGFVSADFDRLFTTLRGDMVDTTMLERKAMEYLRSRGIDVDKYEVGLIDHDKFVCRVVFPFRIDKRVVFCQGRSFMDIPFKTYNTREADGWLPKGAVLWNYDALTGRPTAICEGIFDAASVTEKTGIQATCLLGKTITQKQINLLRKKNVTEVVVFLDNDANREAVSLARLLYECKFKTRIVLWPDDEEKHDPASIDKREMVDLLTHCRLLHPASNVELQLLYS